MSFSLLWYTPCHRMFLSVTNMVSTSDTFSSLDDLKGPKIVLGDDSINHSMGKGRIDLDHGSFNDVLYVPCLIANLL